MDLKERVKDAINTLQLPVTCRLGYLDGKHDPDLRLQVLPGSNVIERDYAGNKTEVASFPHPIMADTTGEVTYVFDFKITVDTFTKEG